MTGIFNFIWGGITTIGSLIYAFFKERGSSHEKKERLMTVRMHEAIVEAEKYYTNGERKMHDVMMSLQMYAFAIKYVFDKTVWETRVNEAIEFSKQVNAKTAEPVKTTDKFSRG